MPSGLTDEHRQLLDRSGTFARVATTDRDGAPQVSVMWFRRAGETIRMVCSPDAAKARNLRRNPRIAVVVEHPDDPYRYFQFRGHAVVRDDRAECATETRALAYRYLGRERGDAYLSGIVENPVVIVEVHVERVTSFVGKNARPVT
jgi:PPOX class probable F420-dependent enzyme